MEKIQDLLQMTAGTSEELPYDEYLKNTCETYNKSKGNLKGYDCPKCANRGYFMIVQDRYTVLRECSCTPIRKNRIRIRKSGLEDVLEQMTFDNFTAKEAWQQEIKKQAMDFAAQPMGQWFYIGGQNGSGKTHICTAIAGELLNRGMDTLYIRWVDENEVLNACQNDAEFSNKMARLEKAQVLYIDDFLFTARDDKGNHIWPSAGNIRHAFQCINNRANKKDLITILSSEHLCGKITRYNQALGSRIRMKSKNYLLNIPEDRAKNYRLR